MATFKGGILGGFSGTVGAVVGSIWKGLFTMRGKQQYTTNPNTPAQQAQRAKFRVMIQFLRPLLGIIRIGYNSLAIGITEFNAAMSYNVKEAIAGVSPDFSVDYPKVKLSSGTLIGALNPSANSPIAGDVEFMWDDNTDGALALSSDLAYVAIVCPAMGLAVAKNSTCPRDMGSCIVTLPVVFSGKQVQCYIFFKQADGVEVSDSTFVGAIEVL